MAIRDRDIAAEALGINLTRYKLSAFMLSATLASVSGSLAAYYSNVVTVEAYTLDLAVIYVAMIIVGGMGSILGGLMGAIFITLLPFGIERLFEICRGPGASARPYSACRSPRSASASSCSCCSSRKALPKSGGGSRPISIGGRSAIGRSIRRGADYVRYAAAPGPPA